MKLFLMSLILLTQSLFAGDIVVMTSLHLKSKKINKIERYFKKSYPNRTADIKFIRAATAQDAAKHLNSPDTEMFFWVSHAAKEENLGIGISAKATVFDYHGNNINNLFSSVHPNVKFLALVGCRAKASIDNFLANNNYQYNTGMNIFSFYKKVNLFRGVKMALQASHDPARNILVTKVENQTIDKNKITLDITREEFGHDSMIEIGDKLFIFPEGENELKVSIPGNVWVNFKSKNLRNVVVQKESEDKKDYVLTKLAIKSQELKKSWKAFAKPSGELLGTFKHLYLLKK